ncbi:FAD/NAD(P)-binding domain-containing protein [Pseudovirgaria hyperparasitica]|uniref:FAD/NAD(P)-binding domain-containing protein n=1 Tax=Pseudovirgaria hyperparasitica TaxID=470096 RepID=A0A6A6WI31_9PEZI|nr:FAD/NAD(P)-binding domain-containing protein [Pseudovirgaria hyperparasitica]KAF2761307.1 FAD/NAD(P)-binding domain-containing protein [Pseudovirgaria hyperparasitica]
MVCFRTDIGATNGHPVRDDNDTYAKQLETDVLIVGAGFGGIYLMHKLRQQGFKCKIYEAGKDLGGIWHWNCYPGARVDSQVPVYEYSIPEVYETWTWSERYPGWAELRRYFDHVDKQLQIRKDTAFETRVTGAEFDKKSNKWNVKTEDGRQATARYLLLATGFAAKRYFPDWKGLNTFEGIIHHSSFWPEEGVDVKGKRVAVIGTGSTGIQLSQETSREGATVTVFQRTPNLCLPMVQRPLTPEDQMKRKGEYPRFFEDRMKTFAGFQYDFSDKNTFDDTPEEREAFFQKLWDNGGFEFWLATYADMLYDAKANDEAYNFWAKKTRARITDPKKRDILAPLKKRHAFGVKRPSLEQDFYEQMDKPTNEVVDVRETPIKRFTKTGIETYDGLHREFDIIALATGFDSVTGGMMTMGLKDVHGVDLSRRWAKGTYTYLGMTCAGFPNLMFLYGAHGPTAFSNGPSCVEAQGNWIVDAIVKASKENITYINPTKDAEEKWHKNVTQISNKTLFPTADSWYMGANIPGKPREQLNYAGGIPLYEKETRAALENWEGFITA